jgi:hypothetical protein
MIWRILVMLLSPEPANPIATGKRHRAILLAGPDILYTCTKVGDGKQIP